MNAHFHYSIESIYASLLFGINTYDMDKVVNTNYRSSILIDTLGEVIIEPWCTVGLWIKLSIGNVLKPSFSFENVFNSNSEILCKLSAALRIENRCYGCKMQCYEESRIVAVINRINGIGIMDGDVEQLFDALKAIDPACLLAS